MTVITTKILTSGEGLTAAAAWQRDCIAANPRTRLSRILPE